MLKPLTKHNLAALIACATLLIFFAILACSAAATKSASFDEPLHLVSGYTKRTAGDFRMNPQDPPFFGYLASCLLPNGGLKPDYAWPRWQAMLKDFSGNEWAFANRTLFETPGTDGDRIIQQTRRVFVLFGVALGGVIAWWSWRLGGIGAAIAATVLFALDPNFLAHAALVKNDVPITLLMLLAVIAVWKFGQRGTWLRLGGIVIAAAAAINMKFSGLLLGPVIFLLLTARAVLPLPWTVGRWNLVQWWQRAIVIPIVCAIVGIGCYITIWGAYQFRFSPTPDPDSRQSTAAIAELAKDAYLMSKGVDTSTYTNDMVMQRRVLMPDTIVWLEARHLFPEAWLDGLMYTWFTTMKRTGFLLGQASNFGWWYYFPCVILFKTPVGILLAFPAAIIGAIVLRFSGSRTDQSKAKRLDWWTAICLGLPALLYSYNAMSTNMNAGIRHILPLYPLFYVATSVVIARLIERWKIGGGILAGLLGLMLIGETATAYPNYLAFFNAPSNTPRNGYLGGFYLLGDSNLDWGQDLKLLANWQKQHQSKPLYLSYFGPANPKFYGVNARHLPGGWFLKEGPSSTPALNESCYLAISATNLQGFYYVGSPLAQNYERLRMLTPETNLGGTIYIYSVEPR